MSHLKSLSNLEFSRYRDGLPGWSARRLGLGAAYLLLPLAGSLFLLRNESSPLLLFAIWAIALTGLMMIISLLNIAAIAASPQKWWWLTFPYPRKTLIYAKMSALLRLGGWIGAILFLVLIAHYAIAVATDRFQPLSGAEFLITSLTYMAFAVAAAPLAIAFGLMVMIMYRGWGRWVFLPWIIMLQVPPSLFGLAMELQSTDPRWISPSYVGIYALGLIVIGWPFTYLVLRLAAGTGMRNVGQVGLRTATSAGSVKVREGLTTEEAPVTNGFAALYKLERTRYRYYFSFLPVRLAGYGALLLIAVGCFFGVRHVDGMLEFSQMMFLLPVMAANIWAMNVNAAEMHQKRLHWWMAFPHDRRRLILTRLAAIWVTVMRGMLAITAAYWIGSASGMILYPIGSDPLQTMALWFAYSLVLYTVAMTVTLGTMQISHYLLKTRLLSILIVPLYFVIPFEGTLINQYFFPDTYQFPTGAPDWTPVWAFIVIGLPVAGLSIHYGAKFLHFLLKNESSPRWAQRSR